MSDAKHQFRLRQIASIDEVDASSWDALDHGRSPFQKHAFLQALELSGSVGPDSGWMPSYLLLEAGEEGALVGAVAAFVKTDSYGEYIFDWAWARAASHFGVSYYPKLTVAAPFTPATGRRLLVHPDADRELVSNLLLEGLRQVCRELDLSGAHLLFCQDDEVAAGLERDYSHRETLQFHWHNRGYASFDDFLAGLKSRKRKQLRKERRKAAESADTIDWVAGGDLQPADLEAMDRFYRNTVAEHGGFDYLRPGFFQLLAERWPDTMLMCRAQRSGVTVAGALFFETEDGLFGRYWGTDIHCEFLHFELAYYQGIERCIDAGIPLFEAGAQGEHKLLRGFEPARTHSLHWLANPRFDAAIEHFVDEERAMLARRIEGMAEYLPFRREEEGQ